MPPALNPGLTRRLPAVLCQLLFYSCSHPAQLYLKEIIAWRSNHDANTVFLKQSSHWSIFAWVLEIPHHSDSLTSPGTMNILVTETPCWVGQSCFASLLSASLPLPPSNQHWCTIRKAGIVALPCLACNFWLFHTQQQQQPWILLSCHFRSSTLEEGKKLGMQLSWFFPMILLIAWKVN